jgi:hypothetical protein
VNVIPDPVIPDPTRGRNLRQELIGPRLVGTIPGAFPREAPLVIGVPDGIVQPATMIATAHGVRIGTEVYVTGTGVEDANGTIFELTSGDITFVDVESDRYVGITETGRPVLAPADLSIPALDPAVRKQPPPGFQSAMDDLSPPEPEIVAAGKGPTRDALAELSYDTLLALVGELEFNPHAGKRGRPSRAACIEMILESKGA